MLIERWERIRGVDRWPEVMAVVTHKSSRHLYSRWGSRSTFLTSMRVDYRAADGALRSKTVRYWMKPCSLDVGDEFYLRCSSEDPSKIYVRESTQDKFLGAICVIVVAFMVWLHEQYR